jgi:hypothetical protein
VEGKLRVTRYQITFDRMAYQLTLHRFKVDADGTHSYSSFAYFTT